MRKFFQAQTEFSVQSTTKISLKRTIIIPFTDQSEVSAHPAGWCTSIQSAVLLDAHVIHVFIAHGLLRSSCHLEIVKCAVKIIFLQILGL